jgi:ligand-binding SRPBCC domain-containing protein
LKGEAIRNYSPRRRPAAISGKLFAAAAGRARTDRGNMMSDPISLRFESELRAPVDRIWEWITSIKGISAEMRPYFRMTTPKGVRSLNDVQVQPGVPMFRSRVFLFGVLPIDYSDMTLMEIDPGQGFIEQSPMGSMKLWRHERRLVPSPADPESTLLVDQLTFQPRMAKRFVGWFIGHVFTHRHKVLRANLGGAQGA